MAQIRFANNVSTQLTKPVAADDSTIEVRSLTQGLVWPDISATGDYFLIVIDDNSASTWEILKCTKVEISGNATTLTVERGLEGTTPSAFNAGSVVENRLTAGTLDTFGAGFPAKVEINRGGTGATTAADARTNLDVPSKADLSSEVSTRTSEVARLDQKIIDNIPPAATTSVRGTTMLSSAVDSVSEAMAATPKAVKTAYDAAISAKSGVDTVDARVTNEVNTLTANIEAVQNSRAPTSHASSSTTYGLATDANYGHVRSDGDTTNIVAGKVVTKDIAIGGDATNLASRRGQIGDVARITTKYPNFSDFNDAIDSGDYFCMTSNMRVSNAPSTLGGTLKVIAYVGGKYVKQIFYIYRTNGILQRFYNGDNTTTPWSAWTSIITADSLATSSTPGIVKPGTGTSIAGDGSIDIDTATTSAKGIVQLSSATNSESELVAATSKAVKAAYDKAVEASNKAGLPLGHIFAWPFSTAPDGCIILNGSTYDRTLYADLFAYVKSKGWTKTEAEWQDIAQASNGFCPWYSEGDGSTNFRTPKFAPYQKIALVSGDAGKYYEAGLPNIEGSMSGGAALYVPENLGSIYGENYNTTGVSTSNRASQPLTIKIDASRSSNIYGNSTTVQPESNDWIVCVVAFGTATNVGSVDVANVMSAVSQVQAEVTDAKEIDSSGYTSSQHWVRYTDGRQIIYSDWGSNFSNTAAITFAKPFTTNPALIGFDNENLPANNPRASKFSAITGTYFQVNDWAYGSATKTGCWVAMGTWK